MGRPDGSIATQMSPQTNAERSRRITVCTKIVAVGITAGLIATLFRVGQLKVDPPDELEGSSGARTALSSEPRFRGTVFDRAGRTIAIDRPVWKLALDPLHFTQHGFKKLDAFNGRSIQSLHGIEVDPHLARYVGPIALVQEQLRIQRLSKLSEELSTRVDIPQEVLRDQLVSAPRKRRYVVLKQFLDDWEVDLLKQWTSEARTGLILNRTTRRINYGPESLAMIIGKVRANGSGGSGIEQRLDSDLQAQKGTLLSKRTSRGSVISIPEGTYQPGMHGNDFQLTLDVHIQELVERRLAEQLEKYNAGGGRCVVMDPRNGDILAMVDLLRRREGVEEAILDDPMRRIEGSLARNRNLVDAFEPGSTFKPFIWAGAVEHGVGKQRSVPRDGQGRVLVNLKPVPIAGRRNTVKDAGNNPYKGPLKDIETILVRSLNTGMIEMVRPLSDRETRDILIRFGFGSRTNCGLAGMAEHSGQVTPLKSWSYANTSVSVSFGHEVSVTTVQMARAFSAFCNDGLMPQLRIVRPTAATAEQEYIESAHLLRMRAVGTEVSRRTKDALKKVVTEGTLSRHARSRIYSMFGKSGTADLPNPAGGYFKDRHTSNVIAAAPFDETRVVVYCVIDDPQKSLGYYGGLVAGPVVKDVIEQTLAYQGVLPDLDDPSAIEARQRLAAGESDELQLGGE